MNLSFSGHYVRGLCVRVLLYSMLLVPDLQGAEKPEALGLHLVSTLSQ